MRKQGFEAKKEQLILHRVRLFVLTAPLMRLPQWGNQAQRILQSSSLDGLGVVPSQVHDQYNNLLEVRRDTGNGYQFHQPQASGSNDRGSKVFGL
jgi:hypothetical protein